MSGLPFTTGDDAGFANWAPPLAEAVGTLVFVFVSAGALCVGQATGTSLGPLGGALAAGFVLAAMMYATRSISGGHLNPVVTFAALLARELPPTVASRYIVAQITGAAVAGILLRILFPAALTTIHLGLPEVADGVPFGRAVAAEAIVAFAWVLTLSATTWRRDRPQDRTTLGPAAVALVYVTSVLVVGPLTGAAGNPARAFGSAFASGTYGGHAVYWVGPVLGAFIAAVIHLLLSLRSPRTAAMPEPEEGRDLIGAAEPNNDALSHYRNGIVLYRNGQLEEAAQQFSLATEHDPQWPEPYYYIGIVYRDFDDVTNANAFFEAALYFRRSRPLRHSVMREHRLESRHRGVAGALVEER